MSSGRRESVMICCISPVSKLYLEPIKYYEPDIVHVFITSRKDAMSSLEMDMYEESKKDIKCKKIVEHVIDTSNYDEIIGYIVTIEQELYKTYRDELDIFINISSGTHEFAAAGVFASMISQSAIPFKVEFQNELDMKELAEFFKKLNESAELSEPNKVTQLKNDSPIDEMLTFLTILDNLLTNGKYPPKKRKMIDELKKRGAWTYDEEKKAGLGKTTLAKKEEVFLDRHYYDIALKKKWLERPSKGTIALTEYGRAYISAYNKDEKINFNNVEYCQYCSDYVLDRGSLTSEMDDMLMSNKFIIGHGKNKYAVNILLDRKK